MYSWVMAPVTDRPAGTPDDLACGPHAADRRALEQVAGRLLPAATVRRVAEVFKLLGDPTRVRIVDVLSHGERCVCDLAGLVGLSESAVSHQLRLLRTARLVRVRRAGRMAFYALDDHHVVGLLHDTRKHVEEEPVRE
jgi:DNA-binding transcriptional ArsR family regulator